MTHQKAKQESEVGDDDEVFDYGKARMDFFKQRARQILIDVPLASHGRQLEDEYLYEGNPMQLKLCYQQLKNLIKRPANNVGQTQEKPNYMKMTFAMSRSVAPNSKILQLSSMVGNMKKSTKGEPAGALQAISGGGQQQTSSSDLTLLRQLKNNGSDFSIKPAALIQNANRGQLEKKKTKREEMIDNKIEKLLITYKQKDEQAKRRAGNLDAEKALGKKNLLDKFGFSDDEESNIEQNA